MTQESNLTEYFEHAASWDADRASMERSKARIAWVVAGVASACTLLSSAALVLVMPLKTVEPFVVRVDARTGIVDSVPQYDGDTQFDEIITRYLLTRYVITCQRYDIDLIESDYFECGAFNSVNANREWAALWNRSNPQSPLNLYGAETHIRVQVAGVTFLNTPGTGKLAQIRYLTARRRGDSGPEVITHFLATVRYAFGKPSQDIQRRQWNPLGFRVEQFQPQVEAVSSDTAATGREP